MATAYVEYGPVALQAPKGSSIHGACVFSEALAISGTIAPGTQLTAARAGSSGAVARITSDTACYVMVGTTPANVGTSTTATTARRYLPAGIPLDLPVPVGQKVGVIAVS